MIVDFLTWLQRHNAARVPDNRVGFYGLDLYSLFHDLGHGQFFLSMRNAAVRSALTESWQWQESDVPEAFPTGV